MNKKLLTEEVQNFINANLNSDLHSLLLKKSPFPEVEMQEIVQQIKGRKTAQKKFPFLLTEGILFPPNLNLEQASSEATAVYKAQNLQGSSFLDLTAGFGIDAYFLSENFDEVTLVEQNPELSETVCHNWTVLGRKAEFINSSLEGFLLQNQKRYSLIYLDPARRDENKNKKFLLEDLSPNLLEIQDQLLAISDRITVKLSPLIDIAYLLSVVKKISQIKIIAVRNEVKELLLDIDKDARECTVSAKNLESDEPEFSFNFNESNSSQAEYSQALQYLYIPNNAVLKSGAFNLVGERFDLKKLHSNTHLYTSEHRISNFPGRVLHVEEINPKDLKKGEKFNIISKNYPLKPEEIKKKYKLKDGGEKYLVFTTTIGGKSALVEK